VDPLFVSTPGANDAIYSVAALTDGRVVVGGFLTSVDGVSRNRVAMLRSNGALETSFDPGTGANGTVYSVLVSGYVYVGGGFSSFNGQPAPGIAALYGTGQMVPAFSPNLTGGSVEDIKILGDGKILAAGYFNRGSGWLYGVIRLNAVSGTVDTSFAGPFGGAYPGANDAVYALGLQADGKIIAGGKFTNYHGITARQVVRLESFGTVDTTFNTGSGADAGVLAVGLQSDGKVVVAGGFTNFAGQSRGRIARLLTSGALDSTFNPGTGANGTIYDLTIQPDGKIIVVGGFTSYASATRRFIARLNTDGTVDATFNPASWPGDITYAVARHPDSKLIIGGRFTTVQSQPRGRVARLFSVPPPIITNPNQPFDTVVPARSIANFAVTVTDAWSNQWYEASTPLAGATNSTLTRTDVRYNSSFKVVPTGAGGSVTSRVAQLTVVYQPGTEFLPPAGADPTNRTPSWTPAVAASWDNVGKRLSADNPPVSTNITITWRDTNSAAIVVSAFVQNIPATNRELAQVISPPLGADLSKLPITGPVRQPENGTYWHPWRQRLYMVAPGPTTNIWKHTNGSDIKVVTIGIWPTNEARYQRHVAGTPPVYLGTNSAAAWSARLMYQEPGAGIDPLNVSSFGRFSATGEGRSLLLQFAGGPTGDTAGDVYFQLVRTVSGNNIAEQSSTTAVIGTNITDTLGLHNAALGQPFVLNLLSRYCALSNYHDRATRTGPIIPVNRDDTATSADDLVLVAYQTGTKLINAFTGGTVSTTFGWPYKPIRYNCQWPAGAATIAVGSLSGSGEIDGAVYRGWNLYVQNDPTLPGFNPNDEHALRRPYAASEAVYALRNDLGASATSEPYVLLTHRDSGDVPRIKVFLVVDAPLVYGATAGTILQPPPPISTLQLASQSYGHSGPYWRDRKLSFWARAAGDVGGSADIVMRFFYPVQSGFYFPNFYTNYFPVGVPATNLPPAGNFPWLDWRAGTPGTPSDVTYVVEWPSGVPSLRVGESLVKTKFGPPDLSSQTSAEILYQQAQALGTGESVKLIDPTATVSVPNVVALPGDVATENQAGKNYFTALPPHLRPRFWHDPTAGTLNFNGLFVEPPAGESYLLLNVLTDRDKEVLLALSADEEFDSHINGLAAAAAQVIEIQPDTPFDKLALTAGLANSEGYVTLAFGNSTNLTPENEPVALSIIRVECPLYRGELKVIESEGPFDEKLTLRHSGDFAGRPEDYRFEWKTLPPTPEGTAPPINDPEASTWASFIPQPANGVGAVDITIQGAGLFTLSDNYFICRYSPLDPTHPCGSGPSPWTTPQLAPGWIKRVVGRINPFTQRAEGGGLEGAEDRFEAFNKPVNTIVSMISQAGPRFEGAVPFNADAVDDFGLIEIYETVLKRGMDLSISGSPSVNYGPANDALLLAAGRLSDLYMLLGNEAYADASDPTIAYGTEGGEYGAEASSIHCFQNQVGSLLEEELALFRGRDDRLQPGTQTRPFYNRLVWNYTQGDGEVAYAANYDIRDESGVVDGVLNEADAKAYYPQAHGDAWGHYLTAIKGYYHLLHNPNFTWVPRIEAVLVGGVPVAVDYLDERKFGKAAAARARAGAEIANLTYRNAYSEDPASQWQGYRDADEDRAWGLSEWGSRAGQGAYFDWVVGNALLPPASTNTGIQKVDRTSVTELREVSASFQTIQEQVDKADLGLNPLGLTKNSIPFDIDPAQIDPPQRNTHFEQIYQRAVSAMNNAIAVFNHANNSTQLLRRQSDDVADFEKNVTEREVDFKNRLIEIFGYPCPEDIGPAGTYPNGYDGPDLYHFAYVDTTLLTGAAPPPTRTLTIPLRELDAATNGALTEQIKSVNYSLATDGYEMVKPPSWTGRRRAPGEIQRNLSDLIQQRTRFQKAMVDYDNLLQQIEDQTALLGSQHRLNREEISLLNESLGTQESLNDAILRARIIQLGLRAAARNAVLVANAVAEMLPKSVGVSPDAMAPARGAIQLAGAVVSEVMNVGADVASIAELDQQQAKESEQARTNIRLTSLRNEFAVQQQLLQLEQLIRQEAGARLELYTMQEALQQAGGNYLSVLARGQRLLEDRLRFRQQTAAQVQSYRYKDMAFRIFRNEALQKYRAQFDHAAMYVFLAAKAYDYETNLRPGDSAQPGREFMNEIVRARTVGLIQGGLPQTGASGDGGLADPMARMSGNFATLKPQLGINNPQPITLEFSLRSQLLRIVPGGSSSAAWREALSRFRVPDLNLVSEFRRNTLFENAQPEPGLVIPFATTVSKDLNHFGWPYGSGDSRFNDEAFATKIRSITVSFRNYRISGPGGMAETVYVYLVPVGSDIMRTPRRFVGDTINFTREWKVLDQWLPLPYQLSGPDDAVLAAPGYIPVNSLASGQQPLAATRAHPKFQAWHDSLTDPITDPEFRASLLISRSVWNTQWLLVIPASSLSSNHEEGLNRFIEGGLTGGARDLNGVSDIRLRIEAYQYSGR
jgi:uncharacterized delta-60 repeat protein